VNIERSYLVIKDLEIEVLRKDIKHLHLGVYPPDGRVRVAAPFHVGDDVVRLAVITRWAWIHRKQQAFIRQERQSPREMASGESHYFFGHRHRLEVIEGNGRAQVRLLGNSVIELYVPFGASREKRKGFLERWCREELRASIAPLLDRWQPLIGVRVREVRIKKMKTRWGSCNIKDGRIWLNLELIKKSPPCLEYILVHEMVHLLERNHNKRFYALVEQFLPHWRMIHEELNRTPLAHTE